MLVPDCAIVGRHEITPLVELMLALTGAVSSEKVSRCGGAVGSLATLGTKTFAPPTTTRFVNGCKTGGFAGKLVTVIETSPVAVRPLSLIM